MDAVSAAAQRGETEKRVTVEGACGTGEGGEPFDQRHGCGACDEDVLVAGQLDCATERRPAADRGERGQIEGLPVVPGPDRWVDSPGAVVQPIEPAAGNQAEPALHLIARRATGWCRS